MICPRCGEEIPARARYCFACGEPLSATRAEARRKLASLLFCDVVGSTELGEGHDAEAVQAQLAAYFGAARECIEVYGGTVEKFIGDAVMAVFGVPQAHEDDAARAVRAAAGIQRRVAAMSDESARRLGHPLRVRAGVATGEVLAGDDAVRMTMVTGDAVNLAARLEQAAGPGEVLVDQVTHELVAESATWSPPRRLALKGKSAPVTAYALADVTGPHRSGTGRSAAAPFVGRRAESAQLVRAFDRAVAESRCVPVTVVGEPGVGKSRLVEEVVRRLPVTRVLRGTCPSYGEGMTYYALRELVSGTGLGAGPEGFTDAVVSTVGARDGPMVAAALLRALGAQGGVSTPEDIAWAARRLWEALAAQGPLTIVVEDVHWAEPPFRELLLSAGRRLVGPVLLVCVSRPELEECGPGWPNVVRLGSLTRAEVGRLAGELLGGELDPAVEDLVVTRSGGNALFAQELVRMLRSEGVLRREGDRWVARSAAEDLALPTSIAALLGARLDRMPAPLRRVLECGSVEGEVFHTSAVERLLGSAGSAEPALMQLRRTGLVAPDGPAFPDDTAYRFQHLLLRDATYRALPKSRRAGLHTRFADWVAERAGTRVDEFEELVAHHLEQALGYRRAAAGTGESDTEDELRIGRMLHRAGVRASARGDSAAAVNLFTRADDYLEQAPDLWAENLVELGSAHWALGDLGEAGESFGRAATAARASLDEGLVTRVAIERSRLRFLQEPLVALEAARQTIRVALAGRLLTSGSAETCAVFELLRAETAMWLLDLDELARGADAALAFAHDSASDRVIARVLECACEFWLNSLPYAAVEPRLDDARRWAASRGLHQLEGSALTCSAFVAADRADFATARRLYAEADRLLDDVGAQLVRCVFGLGGHIDYLAGDFAAAERRTRAALEGLRNLGDGAYYPTFTAHLGDILYRQGRLDEAFECTVRSERLGSADDVANMLAWQVTRGLVLASWQRKSEATFYVERALPLADNLLAADAQLQAAESYLLLGEREAAIRWSTRALETYNWQGNVPMAARATRLLNRARAAPARH